MPGDTAPILHAVGQLNDEVHKTTARAAIEELFALAREDWTIDHQLPKLVTRLDPHGRVVPDIIAGKLLDVVLVPDVEAISEWASFAGWYSVRSPAWRTIAVAACTRIDSDWTDEDRYRVFSCLESCEGGSWVGRPGKLHPRFQDAIDISSKAVMEETDAVLKPYWERQLFLAKLNMQREEGRLEERNDQ